MVDLLGLHRLSYLLSHLAFLQEVEVETDANRMPFEGRLVRSRVRGHKPQAPARERRLAHWRFGRGGSCPPALNHSGSAKLLKRRTCTMRRGSRSLGRIP